MDSLKILFVSNHFSLPYQPGAPRPWEISRYLHTLGHDVTVITNRRHYLDEKIAIGGKEPLRPQIVDGIKIIGVQTSAGRRKTLLKRLINYFSFSYMSYVVGRRMGKWDVIIVGTPPLIVPLTGLILGRKYKAFTVLEIRDLFPETAIALGKVRNKVVCYLWEWWENSLRKKYDHIVAVVPGIRKSLIEKGFEGDKVTTITNGFDEGQGWSRVLCPVVDEFFQEHSDKFVVVYGGGMGYGTNLFPVVQAAELCREEEGLVFALFGEGERKIEYIQYVDKKGLKNTFFFPPQPRLVINQVFRMASALVHSFVDNDFFMCAFPNKIFEYHGAGRPIVFAGTGDAADLIRMAKSGIVVEPEEPHQMAEAFLYLAANSKKAASMGESGLAFIQKYYRRETVFKGWAKVMEMAEKRNRNGHTTIRDSKESQI